MKSILSLTNAEKRDNVASYHEMNSISCA